MNRRSRILVVDDNATNTRILVKSLQKAGYEVLEANDGFCAVDLATAHTPDVILLDLMMPDRDGFEVCRILKAQQTTAVIPIIFLTARSESEKVDEAFSLGGCDYITKPFRISEVKARVSVQIELRQSQTQLRQRNDQLEDLSRIVAERNVELAKIARQDPLTGLLNRGAWEEAARLEHERAAHEGRASNIVMIDVDHFKLFNDSQGHQAGDECLRRVAQCIQSACRAQDIVGRYGGEEFVALMPDAEGNAALLLAERVRQAVYDLNLPHGASPTSDRVTVSLGVADGVSTTLDSVLKQADDGLYTAKRSGRNKTCTSTESLTQTESSEPEFASPSIRCSSETSLDAVDVLVVDDNPTNRALCRAALRRDGHSIREAEDGHKALAEIRIALPDVIVMDVMMPGMDGLECTRRLKGDPETRDIPIIIISACNSPADIDSGLKAGADDYLTKPVRPTELALRVRTMADRTRDRRSLVRSYELRGEQTRVLSLLLELSRTLGRAEDIDDAQRQILASASDLTGCRRAAILLPDPNGKVLRVAMSTGVDDALSAHMAVAVGDPIAGSVFESARAVVLDASPSDTGHADATDATYYVGAPSICAPLGTGENTIGVLALTDRLTRQPFEPREVEYVDLIANIAGTTIHGILTRRARDEARDAIMVAFAKLAEHRDSDTGQHVDRVTQFCLILADALRDTDAETRAVIDDRFLYNIERAAPLHDIGKVAISDRILLKPGKLSAREMAIMKTHAEIGAETIRTVRLRSPGVTILQMAEQIALSHHECFDGSGYPHGIKGNEIPLVARIAAVADVYDALTSKRVYKNPVEHSHAVNIIVKSSGTQFDPIVIDAFLRRETEFEQLAEELGDALPTDADGQPSDAHGQPTDQEPVEVTPAA